MIVFLTSSPTGPLDNSRHVDGIDSKNYLIENFQKYWKPDSKCLYITATPDNYELNDEITLEKTKKHNIDVVIDRLIIKEDIRSRLNEAIELSVKLSKGKCVIDVVGGEEILMSEKYANGKASATEYNEMRTAWMKALSDGVQAKYEFVYRSKILDFYKGVPLTL